MPSHFSGNGVEGKAKGGASLRTHRSWVGWLSTGIQPCTFLPLRRAALDFPSTALPPLLPFRKAFAALLSDLQSQTLNSFVYLVQTPQPTFPNASHCSLHCNQLQPGCPHTSGSFQNPQGCSRPMCPLWHPLPLFPTTPPLRSVLFLCTWPHPHPAICSPCSALLTLSVCRAPSGEAQEPHIASITFCRAAASFPAPRHPSRALGPGAAPHGVRFCQVRGAGESSMAGTPWRGHVMWTPKVDTRGSSKNDQQRHLRAEAGV